CEINDSLFCNVGYRTDIGNISYAFQYVFKKNLDSVRYQEYGFLNNTNTILNQLIYARSYIYMVGATDNSSTNSDILLIKTDTSGNEMWKKKIGLPLWDETALSIDTLDGKLIIAGNKYPHNSTATDGFAMLLDTSGAVIWQKTVPTNGGFGGCMAKRTKDGKILIYNRIKKYSVGSYDYYKLRCEKIDMNNVTIWIKEYGPSAWLNPYAAIENNDGDLVICGQKVFTNNTVSGNVYVINQNGDSLLYKEYRILPNSQNYFRDVVQAPDKGYCFSGFVSPMNGDGGTQDIWLLKVDSNFCESNASCVTGMEDSYDQNGISVFPNPASDELQITFDNSLSSTLVF
ncbi:MAG: hypothetical protein O9333_03920, partial [Beijerinckiaceae bacterium]|nr:hypothetical protein [Beijerinckiaceae bacterium]